MEMKDVLKLVKSGDIESVPAEYWSDKSFVTKAVKINGLNLYYADEKFKSDDYIVALAIENNHNALVYASQELQNEKFFRDMATRSFNKEIDVAFEKAKKVFDRTKAEYSESELKKMITDRELAKHSVDDLMRLDEDASLDIAKKSEDNTFVVKQVEKLENYKNDFDNWIDVNEKETKNTRKMSVAGGIMFLLGEAVVIGGVSALLFPGNLLLSSIIVAGTLLADGAALLVGSIISFVKGIKSNSVVKSMVGDRNEIKEKTSNLDQKIKKLDQSSKPDNKLKFERIVNGEEELSIL